MSDKATNSLFIISSQPRLYQRLLSGAVTYSQLGNRILREIKAAHAFRQIDTVRELAAILINFPIKEFQLVAEYYIVWCQYRDSKYDTKTLEAIIDQTETYKTKALSSRAAIEIYQDRPESALYFYLEALKASPTLSEYVHISRAIAVMKAQDGFHSFAIKDIEKIMPILKHAEPVVYFDILNSYAVELGEVGRKDEARNIIRHVLASPFAKAYPEWLQTAEDLKPANRSFAVLRPTRIRKGKLLTMPIPEHGEVEELDKPAQVINLQQWKKKMGKDDTPNGKTPNEKLDDRELTLRIFQLVATRERTEAELFDILNAVEKVLAEHKNKNKDKDDDED